MCSVITKILPSLHTLICFTSCHHTNYATSCEKDTKIWRTMDHLHSYYDTQGCGNVYYCWWDSSLMLLVPRQCCIRSMFVVSTPTKSHSHKWMINYCTSTVCIFFAHSSTSSTHHTHTLTFNTCRFVYVWDTVTQRILYKLPGHLGSINDVDFHPNEPICEYSCPIGQKHLSI